jgi:type II secretory pathway pseudopilin PulG
MKLHRTPPRRRVGFTLLELMIVIGIILLLISMLIAGISYAFNKADEVKARNEISSLSGALKQFQTDFNTNVPPPSRIWLRANVNTYKQAGATQLDTDSLAFLLKIWPRLYASGNINWGQFNSSGQQPPANDYLLEGEECLIFFTGGRQVQNSSGQWTCAGFATDPTNPMNMSGNFATLGNSKGPYYQFDSNRLFQAQKVGLNTQANFLVYADPFSTKPPPNVTTYAYFSSGKGRNAYNAYASLNLSPDCPSIMTSNAAGQPVTIQPYYQSVNNAPQYYNGDTYQISCAGRDGKFGVGGQWAASAGPAQSALGKFGADDVSNFYDSKLGTVP